MTVFKIISDIGRGGVPARRDAGGRIEVEEKEVCETSFCLSNCLCLRVPGRAIGIEVSHDDVVIRKVINKMKVWYEIGGTAGYRGDVNVINFKGDIVDGGCNGEVLSDGIIWENR